MIKRKSDILAMVGCGPYNEAIPYKQSSIEKWVLSNKARKLDTQNIRINNYRIFEIHTLETRTPEHLEFLKKQEVEIIAQDNFSCFKNAIKYPLEGIISAYNSQYFLCSFSYMVALAMYMGYKEIQFYGVNMIFNDDYIQKYNFEYWLGRAEQLGIDIVFTENCDLLKCGKIYGYEAVNTLAVYQNKYMHALKGNQKNLLQDIDIKLDIVAKNLEKYREIDNLLTNERKKFMQEILDRHEINIIKDDKEDEEE